MPNEGKNLYFVYLLKKYYAFFCANQIKVESILLIGVISYVFYFQHSPDWQNILLGIFSSLILLILFNLIQLTKDFFKFNYLYGKFKRIRFYEFESSPTNPEKPYKEHIGYYNSIDEHIQFNYNGSGMFTGHAEYKEGKVDFELSLDALNPSMGKGSYHYVTEKKDTRALQNLDFGNYSSFKYTLNVDYVILYHENVVPSKKAAGYELLQSMRTFNNSISKIKSAILKKRKLKIRLSNSHDYTNDGHFLILWPYKLAIEKSSGDDIVYGYVEESLSGYKGFTMFSVPFISTIEIIRAKFIPNIPTTQEELNTERFELTFPK